MTTQRAYQTSTYSYGAQPNVEQHQRPKKVVKRTHKKTTTTETRFAAIKGVIVVAVVFGVMLTLGVIKSDINYQNNLIESENAKLQREVITLKSSLQNASNLEVIEQKATEELGMVSATGDQYVTIEKNDKGVENLSAKLREEAFK